MCSRGHLSGRFPRRGLLGPPRSTPRRDATNSRWALVAIPVVTEDLIVIIFSFSFFGFGLMVRRLQASFAFQYLDAAEKTQKNQKFKYVDESDILVPRYLDAAEKPKKIV